MVNGTAAGTEIHAPTEIVAIEIEMYAISRTVSRAPARKTITFQSAKQAVSLKKEVKRTPEQNKICSGVVGLQGLEPRTDRL